MNKLSIYTLILVSAFMMFSCDEEDKLINDILTENPIPGEDEETGSAGENLDLSKYVAVGASITAGTQDGTLYTDGQMTCFPALLTDRFAVSGVGGGAYGFPDIGSINGYSTTTEAGKISLVLDANCDGALGDVAFEAAAGDNTLADAYAGDKTALTNFGVPGINSSQFDEAGVGNPASPFFNPYYARFASNPGVSTIIDDAVAASPTFFTLWMGGNDVLGYAAGGGMDADLLTSQADFTTRFSNAIGKLAATGADGIVINVPPIVVLPYFRAVAWDGAEVTVDQATALNAAFEGFNSALDGIVANLGFDADDAAARKVSYTGGEDDCGDPIGNPFLIEDFSLEDLGPYFDNLELAGAITEDERAALAPYEQARPLRSTELVTMAAGTLLGTLADPSDANSIIGVAVPLSHSEASIDSDPYILDETEQGAIVVQRVTLNSVIAGVMASGAIPDNIKLFDIQPIFADAFGLNPAVAGDCVQGLCLGDDAVDAADENITTGDCPENIGLGITRQGYNYAPDFSPNGIFSNDGIHVNPRGHAVLTNALIDMINDEFDANVPHVDIDQLRASPFQACPSE